MGLPKQATKNDPSLTNGLSAQVRQAAAQGIKIYAIGPTSGAFIPNLNIAIESSAGQPTGQAFLSAIDADAKIELSEIGPRTAPRPPRFVSPSDEPWRPHIP